jgi:hypothetical protein
LSKRLQHFLIYGQQLVNRLVGNSPRDHRPPERAITSPRARLQGRWPDAFVKTLLPIRSTTPFCLALALNRRKNAISPCHGRLPVRRLIIKQAAPKSRLQPSEKRVFSQTCNAHGGGKACSRPVQLHSVPGSSPKATISLMSSLRSSATSSASSESCV